MDFAPQRILKILEILLWPLLGLLLVASRLAIANPVGKSKQIFFFFGYISILQSVQWYFLDTYYDGSVVESFYVSMDDNISGKMNDDSSVFAQCICTYTYNSLEAKNTYSPYSLHSVVIIHTCILYT